MHLKHLNLILWFTLLLSGCLCSPTPSLVVSTTESSKTTNKAAESHTTSTAPKISWMHVKSTINNRFSHTTITTKVKNVADVAQETVFSIALPEEAFIAGFVMEVDGKNYTALVKEKEAAKVDYEQAIASGAGAAHVVANARDSNTFTISVNIEPEGKAIFYLTYEQLLKRHNGLYEQIINLHPRQLIDDLAIEVFISESRKLTNLKAPPLRSGNEIGTDKDELKPNVEIQIVNDTWAIISFKPSLKTKKRTPTYWVPIKQKDLPDNSSYNTTWKEILKVERSWFKMDISYTFFAPTELTTIPKHVLFVLDTSGSMGGLKILQLKEAMYNILDQLNANDAFTLIEFNTNVRVWNLDFPSDSIWFPLAQVSDPCIWQLQLDGMEDVPFTNYKFPKAYSVNAGNIKKAKDVISNYTAYGGTDIYTSLRTALHLVKKEEELNEDGTKQSMIVFLTDGDPTIRVQDPKTITTKITDLNSELNTPIFTLSFGGGVDKAFLETLSLKNGGFSKHIYEAADAALQLQEFYKQISSPLLSNVTFKYEPSVTSLTITEFPIHFDGAEIVVSGWSATDMIDPGFAPGSINAWNGQKYVKFVPRVTVSVSSIERLWAYLTIKQLLNEKEISEDDKVEIEKKALDLALKYSFVTPLTSLIVVKPNSASVTDFTSNSGTFSPTSQSSLLGATAIPNVGGSNPYYTATHRPVYQTTPFCPNLYIPTTEKINLLVILPWLMDKINEGNIKLPSGVYKLGLNETFTETERCNDPSKVCKLLSHCHQIYSNLTSFDDFVKNSCVLKKEFAGVCCLDN